MTFTDFLEVLGGFGIILFSLRFLSKVLETSISKRLKPWLNSFLKTNYHSFILGFLMTLFTQASNITIITAMGFLNTSFITLEQSFFIMLGSTIGTTIKAGLFVGNFNQNALIFIGISSLSLIVVKKPLLRDIFQIFFAIGLVFLGFELMELGLFPLSNSPMLLELISFYEKAPILSKFAGVLAGCIISISLQSTSTVLILVMGFVYQDIIPYKLALAVVLGANLGTTFTSLIVSIEHSSNVKRLAVAHLIVKLLGVCVAFIFISPLSYSIDFFLIHLFKTNDLGIHLLVFNIIFNILNVMGWWFFASSLIKFLNLIIPEEIIKTPILPNSVKKMIMSNQNVAIQEIENQISFIENIIKNLTDDCFDFLINNKRSSLTKNTGKEFESIRECANELLIGISYSKNYKDNIDYIREKLMYISKCNDFFYYILDFRRHLELGLSTYSYKFPPQVHNYFEEIQKVFNLLWLNIILEKITADDSSIVDESFRECRNILEIIENFYFFFSREKVNINYKKLSWIYQTLNQLERILDLLNDLYKNVIDEKL